MAEHFTKYTEGAPKWCNKCGRHTIHAVSGGRVGRCTEHKSPLFTKAQLRNMEKNRKDALTGRLF